MSNPGIDNDQGEFIQAFVEEGREMLDEVEPLLIELEQASDPSVGIDPEVLNTIFRLFHSLKGAAGFLDLYTVSKVTHEAETLLDIFRKGEALLRGDHIDLFNLAADFIRKLLGSIEENLHDKGHDDDAGKIVDTLKKAIDELRSDPQGTKSAASKPSAAKSKKAAPKKQGSKKSSKKSSKTIATDDQNGEMQFVASPELIKQFVTEGEELLESAEQSLLSLEHDSGNQETLSTAFRAFHSFKGNAGFLGYADLEAVSHQAETLLDTLRSIGAEGQGTAISLLLSVIDFLRGGLSALNEGNDPEISGKAGIVSLLSETIVSLGGTAPETPQALDTEDETEDDQDEPVEMEAESENNSGSEQFPERRSGIDRRTGDDGRSSGRRAADKINGQRQTIRVDIEKLDILMNLVGELVISEAMVSQNPDIKELNVPMDRFERSVLQLNKITRDLQDVTTSIRMIPLAGTFRKMIRLVRDLSQKVGKKIDLELIGEETEVDKTVIEQITDPLVHIIRNSIDHGLEGPEERLANNKSDTGKITLEARYVGGEVWIIINDDGKGLNREKILSRAIEKGLVDGDGLEMKDEDVWLMIFQPGFSTAEKITDVSGRGVGMDVVRRNIEKTRGKVEVKSDKGRGTSVILRIPLTLAIIDGMVVRIGETLLTVPIISIKESFQPTGDIINILMDGQEIVNIRDHLFPVVRLYEIFQLEPDSRELCDGILVMVENEGKAVCLFVDEVVGQQQVVIKGLSDYVGDLHTVSGCTIMGDGTISLILDIKGIIDKAEGEIKGLAMNQRMEIDSGAKVMETVEA